MAYNTRILIFSTTYLPYIGGAELALKEITDRIKDLEFDLITTRSNKDLPKEERIGNINVYRVSQTINFLLPKNFYPISAFLKALNLQKHFGKYNKIFVLQASQGAGAAWLFKLFNPKVLFILNIQEGKNLKAQGFLINFFRNLVIRKADIITVISSYLKDYAANINKKAKIIVIPNGADLEKFKNHETVNMEHKTNRTIITVSRLVEKNGVGDLIEAFNILYNKYKTLNAKLLIIGDGPLKESLKFKVKSLNLEDKVEFLGEILPDNLPEYLIKADVFVRPSLSEGLGMAFLEAMAAGLPIIGTSVGGIPDFLIDSETGLFCKVSDPDSLADKTKTLFENKLLWQKLSENGRKLVEEKYSWDKISDEYVKIFKNLTIKI